MYHGTSGNHPTLTRNAHSTDVAPEPAQSRQNGNRRAKSSKGHARPRRDILYAIAETTVRESLRHLVDVFFCAREARKFQADELEVTE
jgi:hypothetical protein